MVDEVLRSLDRCPDEVRSRANAALIDFDVRARLGEVDVPTLVIAGSRDLMTPASASREIAAGIEGSRLEILDGAGHMLIWERAEVVADRLAGLAGSG